MTAVIIPENVNSTRVSTILTFEVLIGAAPAFCINQETFTGKLIHSTRTKINKQVSDHGNFRLYGA
jgi:hypothetical protein